MSQKMELSDQFETFCEEKGYEKRTVCPYCGDDSDLDSPKACCGERHAEEQWVSESESLDSEAMQKAFDAWLEERAEAAESSRYSEKDEPEYWEDR